MQVDPNVSGISKTGPEMALLGPEIQGNILKSHGRGHTSSIFITFAAGNQGAAKQFISRLPVTSAKEQASQKPEDEKLFVGFYLSQAGYQYLGIPDGETPDFFKSANPASMQEADLNDPPMEFWDSNFESKVHAMVLLAWGNSTDKVGDQLKRGLLDTKTASIVAQVNAAGIASRVFVETGDGIKRKGTGDDIEHFGYVDGISQPRFFIEDQTSHGNWDSMMPLSLVLTTDPGGKNTNAFGSYLVFRKLEQNVKGFKKHELELADHPDLKLAGADRERAGAMVIGRFEDGTPVTLQAADGMPNAGHFNDFTYGADATASKCPFHAHIRKTNPRGETTKINPSISLQSEKEHMMARRGIIYGIRKQHPNDEEINDMPEGDVGLLFMSFQSDLVKQFEFIQKSWANSEDFISKFLPGVGQPAGLDPTIGQGAFTPGLQRYAAKWGDDNSVVSPASINFQSFVTMKGGEYFFAPSMSFLKTLAE